MSDNDSRKSMDDVLASIRRIVRSEREPQAEEAQTVAGTPDADKAAGDMPLELTPAMMSDGDGEAEDASGEVSEFVSAPEPLGDSIFTAPPAAAAAPAAPAMDEDRIRELIREVVREELADGDGAGLVREIIKAELTTGEIGGNISRNVLRLIRSEVAKANG